MFPYRGIDGTVNCFVRGRLHVPKGEQKYDQPAGSPARGYFPQASLKNLNYGQSDIFIVEGEKKVLAVAKLGLAAVGIGGIWNGRGRRRGVDRRFGGYRLQWPKILHRFRPR